MTMTPQNALDLLGQCAAKYLGTLADHQALQQAVQVLQGVLHDKTTELPRLSQPDDVEAVAHGG
jgi:hypothetical protein